MTEKFFRGGSNRVNEAERGFAGANPDWRLDMLPMMDDEERAATILEWNRTETAGASEATVMQRFEAQTTRAPRLKIGSSLAMDGALSDWLMLQRP